MLPLPLTKLLEVYRGDDFQPLYTTTVDVWGGEERHGRASGIARSDDGSLNLELRLPTALGGPGGGTNPEQLFAAAYGTAFHGAIKLLATKHDIEVPDMSLSVTVTLGRDPADGRFCLNAHIVIRLPGLERPLAEQLVRETERICSYPKLSRQGAKISVRVET